MRQHTGTGQQCLTNYKFLQHLSRLRRHVLYMNNLLPILNQSVKSIKICRHWPLRMHPLFQEGIRDVCSGPPVVSQRMRASRIKNNKTRKRRKCDERREKWARRKKIYQFRTYTLYNMRNFTPVVTDARA